MNDLSRTPRQDQWEVNHRNSIWPFAKDQSADEVNFSPNHDYFDLNQLVSRICYESEPETKCCAPTAAKHHSGSLVFPQELADKEDIFNDFYNNGHNGLPYAPMDAAEGDERQREPSPTGQLPTNILQYKTTWCVFCKKNGESESLYRSHFLKDGNGKTTCPILRAYICPLCGAKGDFSHTIKYCPTRKDEVHPAPLETAHTSAGRKRTRTQSSQTTMKDLY